MNKVRLLIADYLNRREGACWANLVLWALGYQSLMETFGTNGNWKSQICRRDCGATPFAYCGKCQLTGRYYNGI